jgi:hypothetical protein
VPSQLADIQPGDQVRVIGTSSGDGTSITAERLYSGAFRTLAGIVTALTPDSKGLTLRKLQDKQPLQVTLSEGTTIHKLPPEVAAMAARRLNVAPDPQVSTPAQAPGQTPATSGMRPQHRGDMAQMIQHLPAISLTELKPGDVVIIAGVFTGDKSQLVATNIIAGVEPILQSPAGRSRDNQGLGEWSLDLAVPNQ